MTEWMPQWITVIFRRDHQAATVVWGVAAVVPRPMCCTTFCVTRSPLVVTNVAGGTPRGARDGKGISG